MFSINCFESKNKLNPISKVVDTEEEASAIVDSLVARGVAYLTVMAIIPTEEDHTQYNLGWQSCGSTILRGKEYNVYLLAIEGTY